MRLLITFIAAATLLASTAWGRPLTSAEKIRDFQQLTSLMRAGYGPVEYKKTAIDVDIDELEYEYLQLVQATPTNAEYYYLVVKFVAEFQDSHFAARIPTNHSSRLPILVDLVEGRALVEAVIGDDLGVERGDELLAINDQPVGEIITELAEYVNAGYQATRLRIATQMLTSRRASVVPVPRGAVRLTIKKRDGSATIEKALEWKESGTPLGEDEIFSPLGGSESLVQLSPSQVQISVKPQLEALLGAERVERSYACSGSTRIAIPEDATILMQSPFVAYYHPTPMGNVGYLRIPHYFPTSPTGEFEFELRFAQYEWAIKKLEDNTVGLVIDQDHNCGGSVGYLHDMVGLFAESEYDQMQFELLATKASYLEMKGYLDAADPRTLEYEDFKKTVDLVENTWREGTSFLTTKIGFVGDAKLYPNRIRYTKPIVMLIDEMSGSGGDAFPAIMGGIGRAKLIGQRTMGAGGHVVGEGPLNYSLINFSVTKSLFYRPDGVPVENNGAVPAIEYEITEEDFVDQYRPYQRFYLEQLAEMVN